MKKINFSEHVLPHAIAIVAFLIVTVFFFGPVFFENKSLVQGDVQQSIAVSKSLRDYRDQTGEEGLWASSMFSGMPGYMVTVEWGYTAVSVLKRILALGLPHPVANIFLAFISYYIMLLVFRIRPYLAIAGALAFGLSSFMIIGLSAGHNARIGAMAFMPLVMAGIHLSFSGKRVLGFGVTAAALALHLRENHLQVTYYLLLIVLGYGLMQLIVAIREKKISEVFKTVATLVPAALLAAGTFFGPLWAVYEYTPYSTRGKTELITPASVNSGTGLNRDYVFNYSNGILEPMVMMVPNFYGGANSQYFFRDQNSESYKALMATGNEQLVNSYAQYTSQYWGEQPFTAPYYAGAIIVFLFVVGIIFAERKYTWWLVSLTAFAIVLSWGKNFETFNYFLFDHLPGYSKFRSVTFVLVIAFFSMPLLGLIGLEKFLENGATKETKNKLLIAFAATGGVCLLLVIFGGMLSFLRNAETNLPDWFASALRADRKSVLKSDAFRSFGFIVIVFGVLYFNLQKRLSPYLFYAFLGFVVMIDLVVVDKRYFAKENYKRKREAAFTPRPVEEQLLQDKSYFRVLSDEMDGRASYYFNSLLGYHGAILKRYENLQDSALYQDVQEFFTDVQQQKTDYSKYGIINMLNCKYIIFGQQAGQFVLNRGAAGPAWFVSEVVSVNSPTEELAKVEEIDTRKVAVVDASKFQAPTANYDSASSITITERKPNYMKYEATTKTNNLAVFSEIYYAPGWSATIDGKEVPILRVNYVLRALEIPAGTHTVEFKFAPKSYTVGNPITTASSWIMLVVLLGSIGWSLRKEKGA
ncbi:MAG TPA: YfhO family protein [Cyclobacteriaceae bacterium]|nr:YfhO family protein [Cyclobacteriaceae bacterium]